LPAVSACCSIQSAGPTRQGRDWVVPSLVTRLGDWMPARHPGEGVADRVVVVPICCSTFELAGTSGSLPMRLVRWSGSRWRWVSSRSRPGRACPPGRSRPAPSSSRC
jgi:hypothetical protein